MTRYELKLATGKIVSRYGTDALDAAHRYVDAHPEAAVVATRPYPVHVGPAHPSQIEG